MSLVKLLKYVTLGSALVSCGVEEPGCSTDHDCKGERVCVQGECVGGSSENSGGGLPIPGGNGGSTENSAGTIWPLAVGNRWLYQAKPCTEEVLTSYISAEDEMGRFKMEDQILSGTYITSLSGWFSRKDDGTYVFDEHDCLTGCLLWKYPTFQGDVVSAAGTTVTTTKLGHQVEVPAGSFPDCVTYTNKLDNSPFEVSATFCLNVGLVRSHGTNQCESVLVDYDLK